MLVQIYRVKSSDFRTFYILLREDDHNLTMSMSTVTQVVSGLINEPAYSSNTNVMLFLEDDLEVMLLNTVPHDEVFPYINLHATLVGGN